MKIAHSATSISALISFVIMYQIIVTKTIAKLAYWSVQNLLYDHRHSNLLLKIEMSSCWHVCFFVSPVLVICDFHWIFTPQIF